MSRMPTRVATASQTVGPFFHFALTRDPMGRIAEQLSAGDPIRLVIRVTDGGGQPMTDGMVELRQAGAFGRMPTDEDGSCEFAVARPGTVPDGRPPPHAPHIGLCFFARGLLRHLYTRIYLADNPLLADDPVLRLVPERRRNTLLARPDPGEAGVWRFELRLQGELETVFFDL